MEAVVLLPYRKRHPFQFDYRRIFVFIFSSICLSSYFNVLQSRPISLTPENYHAVTKGKTLMVRFYVVELEAQSTGDDPCPSCKVIERHWFNLAEKWSNHPFALLADVKCVWDGSSYVNNKLCQEFNVNKLLQFKFGDPLAMEPIRWYDWELVTYDTLAEFANEHLSQPVCTLLEESLPFCKRRELLQLRKALSSTEEELQHGIEREERKMSRIEDVDTEIENIKAATEVILDNYIQLKKEKEDYWKGYIAIVTDAMQKTSNTHPAVSDTKQETNEHEEQSEVDCGDIMSNQCDEIQRICAIYTANSNGESCDPVEMNNFITILQEAEGNIEVMNSITEEMTSKIHNEHEKIDAQILVLMNTAEKLKRDLVEEAEFLYHSARENGYYFMKSAYKKKVMQKKAARVRE